MDEGRRLSTSNGSAFGKAELWHSTPVKKKNVAVPLDVSKASGITSFRMDTTANHWPRGAALTPSDTLCPPSFQETPLPVSDPSGSTIQRQRRELQLLIAELKDREKELNVMAASHHKQHRAWEQDRQRVLSLEQRCARLDEELQKRNEVIRVLSKRVWLVETREKDVQEELSTAQQQLCELQKKQQHISERCQDFEEKNQSLSSTVMALSTQVGSLQVREEELSSMLKLKDKDVTEASNHVLNLSGRLREQDAALTESRSRESMLLRELEENKHRCREATHQVAQLKEELQLQVTQSSTQREEIIRLKQELQLLHRDLVLTGEGDSWKDELLELARSKQERIMSELRCLQQVCDNQQNDLQLLRLNQESAHESLREKTSLGLFGSQDELTCHCIDRRSSSSLRRKNLRPVHDTSTPPAADLQASANSELGVFSAHLTDGDVRLSSCSLQQLLDESRLVTAGSENSSLRRRSSLKNSSPAMNCGTTEPLYFHERLTPQQHPSTSILQQTDEAPPKACPPHGAHQPATWTS
ncbi:coiled-coil domain-containing protein 62 isoform X1 [Acanthochromis polyacanthus]|uniref:coiled-coil domain-containing protein 62 isoform X1 n=1 Tax=Acanthochromis polyacanthus TaxID=80966 RepID=UPI000B8FACA8|nr:coiled-coil domain-containing protein 62 isoform X1 [Acanthochromis polyacanthus]